MTSSASEKNMSQELFMSKIHSSSVFDKLYLDISSILNTGYLLNTDHVKHFKGITNNLKRMMSNHTNICSKNDRIVSIIGIFKYIALNKYIVNYVVFGNIIKRKMEELLYIDNVKDMEQLYIDIFGYPINPSPQILEWHNIDNNSVIKRQLMYMTENKSTNMDIFRYMGYKPVIKKYIHHELNIRFMLLVKQALKYEYNNGKREHRREIYGIYGSIFDDRINYDNEYCFEHDNDNYEHDVEIIESDDDISSVKDESEEEEEEEEEEWEGYQIRRRAKHRIVNEDEDEEEEEDEEINDNNVKVVMDSVEVINGMSVLMMIIWIMCIGMCMGMCIIK